MPNDTMTNYTEISKCRLCGSHDFASALNLGNQALTGVFPSDGDAPFGPLELTRCTNCNLLQLKHSYDPDDMYGENYGYRSGLNQSMVDHLSNKIANLEKLAKPLSGDVVLDIGSNDCTTLKAYSSKGLVRIGIDPTAEKFSEYYPEDVKLSSSFFSADAYKKLSEKPAKIITSIAMFYDLEDPIQFARDVCSILDDDGVWHFEQSYMPSMLRLNSYDTICHEHIEYYSLTTVKRILDAAGMKILDVVMNNINGGSFAVTATKDSNTSYSCNDEIVQWLLEQETRMELNTNRPYEEFSRRVFQHREDLVRLIQAINQSGKKVLGYGASTKGNVVLQFCGLTDKDIPAIADVNPEKFGRKTPGTKIPIISEADAKAMQPDYFLVLPWHFKEGILKREKEFLSSGGRFIFPFPEIEII